MKYNFVIAGVVIFLLGYLFASRAYDFICSCPNPNPINDLGPCYQCMNSPTYQNYMLLFQAIMIVSVFIVLYGFFTEFEYKEEVKTPKQVK